MKVKDSKAAFSSWHLLFSIQSFWLPIPPRMSEGQTEALMGTGILKFCSCADLLLRVLN